MNKETRFYVIAIFYAIIFLIIAIALFSFYENSFQVLICSLIITGFLSLSDFLKIHRRLLLFDYVLCYITFSLLAIFISKDYVAVFAFSFFLVDYPVYYFLNKVSLKKYGREIYLIGGPGFNIRSENTFIDIIYGIGTLILGLIYLYLILIFDG